jgi:hypothetical protein
MLLMVTSQSSVWYTCPKTIFSNVVCGAGVGSGVDVGVGEGVTAGVVASPPLGVEVSALGVLPLSPPQAARASSKIAASKIVIALFILIVSFFDYKFVVYKLL